MKGSQLNTARWKDEGLNQNHGHIERDEAMAIRDTYE